mgnify:CR=1 FL=1
MDHFKTLEELQKSIAKKREEDSKFSWEKASKMLGSWKKMMKEGCVSEEAYLKRRRVCEGIEGMTDPCPNLYLRESDGKYFCGSCGCGHRDMAVLFIKGKEVKEDRSIRLWMPDNNCPKDLHKDEEGTGNFKPIGGKLKQLASLAKASLKEISNFVGTTQEDAVVLAQSVIEENVSSSEEVDQIVELIENEQETENEQDNT